MEEERAEMLQLTSLKERTWRKCKTFSETYFAPLYTFLTFKLQITDLNNINCINNNYNNNVEQIEEIKIGVNQIKNNIQEIEQMHVKTLTTVGDSHQGTCTPETLAP